MVNAATPVLMPSLDDVGAVLIPGLPGQEGGNALVEVLNGDAEPTGRLLTTYPAADGASPAWNVIPGVDFGLDSTDGTAIGYRGSHAGNTPAPLFWFGHGLGYGAWEHGNPRLVPTEAGQSAVVEVDITNTCSRASPGDGQV